MSEKPEEERGENLVSYATEEERHEIMDDLPGKSMEALSKAEHWLLCVLEADIKLLKLGEQITDGEGADGMLKLVARDREDLAAVRVEIARRQAPP